MYYIIKSFNYINVKLCNLFNRNHLKIWNTGWMKLRITVNNKIYQRFLLDINQIYKIKDKLIKKKLKNLL